MVDIPAMVNNNVWTWLMMSRIIILVQPFFKHFFTKMVDDDYGWLWLMTEFSEKQGMKTNHNQLVDCWDRFVTSRCLSRSTTTTGIPSNHPREEIGGWLRVGRRLHQQVVEHPTDGFSTVLNWSEPTNFWAQFWEILMLIIIVIRKPWMEISSRIVHVAARAPGLCRRLSPHVQVLWLLRILDGLVQEAARS